MGLGTNRAPYHLIGCIIKEGGLLTDIELAETKPTMITESFDVDTSQPDIEIAREAGGEAARLHYDNTASGQYVPEDPMDPDWTMLENTLGREPTDEEREAFSEAFTDDAEGYNCEIEMYGV